MLLPLLANPWVAAIAAIALVGGVMLKMAKDIENARKEGINLGKAMSMTSEKLQSLSETTGTVSANEEANRRRTNVVSGSTDSQRQFGQNILESNFGKNLLNDIETSLIKFNLQNRLYVFKYYLNSLFACRLGWFRLLNGSGSWSLSLCGIHLIFWCNRRYWFHFFWLVQSQDDRNRARQGSNWFVIL